MSTRKKILSLFLAVLMIISSLPAAGLTAFAFEADEPVFIFEEISDPIVPEGYYLTGKTNFDEEGAKIYQIDSLDSQDTTPFDLWIYADGTQAPNPDVLPAYPEIPEDGVPDVMGEDELPSSYDSRDYGYITPVEDQIGGTCWAHTSIACIETAYIKQGYGNTLDLSEYHTVWYSKNGYFKDNTDSLNDGYEIKVENDVLDKGGNYIDISNAMLNFAGGAKESSFPLTSTSSSAMMTEMKDSFTFDKKYTYDVVLDSVKSIEYYELEAEPGTTTIVPNKDKPRLNYFKQAVMDYGAVYLSYGSYGEYYANTYSTTKPTAYYCPEAYSTNHAVTLVGWDDNFSKDNFGTYKPENDGAWLIKNSWGTGWGDDGYFWMSYEDKTLNRYAAVFEIDDKDDYEEVYMYDGLGYKTSVSSSNGKLGSANVFTAENDIYLTKVSYGSTTASDYTLDIYTDLPENCTDPTAGTKIYSQTGNTDSLKYIEIEGNVEIAKGTRFSVVLTMNRVFFEGSDTEATEEYLRHTSNPGESFFEINGVWYDTSSVFEINSRSYDLNNSCVRAVAKNQQDEAPYKITFKDGSHHSKVYVSTDGTVKLPERQGYTYEFTYESEPFTQTTVDRDLVVSMHCYPTDGTISERSGCITEYKCIYCGCEMKAAVENHDFIHTVIPATVKTIGYTENACKNCSEKSISDYTLYEGADGGKASSGTGSNSTEIWWQFIDGNLCVYPAGQDRMPDYASSSATPWAAYLDEITSLTVGDGITYLGDYMFSDLPALSELNLTDSITEIGDYCFSGAKALKVFDCPEALTKIGTYAFNGAVSLEEINYNDTIKTLGKYAYNGCTSLTEGVIPGTVTSVGEYIFYNCSNITKIIVNEGVTRLPYVLWCNSGNSKLEEIVLPSTATNVTFMNYASIDKYTVSPDNKVYCSVDGVVYSKDMKTLYTYPATKADKYYKIPESVNAINYYAFSYVSGLKYLDMSACAVTVIKDKTFNQTKTLSYINLPVTLTNIWYQAFYRTRIQNIYVPSTVTSYQNPPFDIGGSTYYNIPDFYTDSETAKIKEFADAKSYSCTTDHTVHSYTTEMSDMKKAATCKNEGTSLKVCVCGSFEYTVIPATGEHSLVKGTTVAPTCTAAGYTVYTCSACGYTENKDKVTALSHSFTWITDEEATCGKAGKKHEKCSRCDATQSFDTVIPATGKHSYSSEITTPATHLKQGVETFTCSGCGDTYTKSIAKLTEHTYNKAVTAPTCTDKGYTTYTCACGDTYTADETASLGHSFTWITDEEATCGKAGKKHEKCSSCEATQSFDTVIPATGEHSYSSSVTTKPTCTEKGVETFTCSTCGDSYTKAIDANGHTASSAVQENRVAPKCETKGSYDEVVYCSICSAQISRVKKDIEATDHNWDNGIINPVSTCKTHGIKTFTCLNDNTHTKTEKAALDADNHEGDTYLKNYKAATCMVDGYTGDTYCSGCNVKIKAGSTITAPGHTTVNVKAKAPTCTEAGYEAYEYCTVCDYTTYKSAAATGHSYKKTVTAPTCTDKGYTTYACTCGDTYTADEKTALGHSYSSEVITAPTCTRDGVKKFTCANCSDTYTKSVTATGHSYKKTVTAPTCTDKGYTTYA